MNKKEFYRAVKQEGLDKYNLGDSKENYKAANVIGVTNDNGWIVFETDERATFRILSRYSSEEEALDALLGELRNKKRKEDILGKLHHK